MAEYMFDSAFSKNYSRLVCSGKVLAATLFDRVRVKKALWTFFSVLPHKFVKRSSLSFNHQGIVARLHQQNRTGSRKQ